MTGGLGDLVAIARLIRDRELAALSDAERAVEEAARHGIRARIEANRELVQTSTDPAMHRAFENWLKIARRDAAIEAARLESLRESVRAQKARAARAFGRTLALEELERRQTARRGRR